MSTTSIALFYSKIIDFGSNFLDEKLRDQFEEMVEEAYDKSKELNIKEISRAFDMGKVARTGLDYYNETYNNYIG
jgi:hypothetical protein